jgi:hypothetical protein
MTKLRTLLAAALLTLAVGSLQATPSVSEGSRVDLGSTHQATGVCWIFWAGRWWEIAC